MENWDILGQSLKADRTLNDYMAFVMESAFYFEGFPFGSTLKEYADSFEIDAYYASEDEDSGFCDVREGEGIVELTVVFGKKTYCLAFVFHSDDDYGVFHLFFAKEGEDSFEDIDEVMAAIEPYFSDEALNNFIDLVMNSSYYFEGYPFGETIRRHARDFTISAGFAEEGSDTGMYPVEEGECLVTIETTLSGQRYYLEFVFKAEDDYSTFYLSYGEIDGKPADDFEEFLENLAPCFQ